VERSILRYLGFSKTFERFYRVWEELSKINYRGRAPNGFFCDFEVCTPCAYYQTQMQKYNAKA